jgi:hypothetical protein
LGKTSLLGILINAQNAMPGYVLGVREAHEKTKIPMSSTLGVILAFAQRIGSLVCLI